MGGFPIVERLLDWIGPVYMHAGYAVVAAGIFLERTMFLGLIVPGELVLAIGGVFAARGDLNVVLVALLGMSCGIVGESIGWWLGRRYGRSLVTGVPLLRRLEGRLSTVEDYFEAQGGKTVAVGRYAVGAGAFVPFTAGMAGMRYRRFLMFDAPSVIVWATGITLLGFFFGRNVERIDRILSRFGIIVLVVLVLFVAGWIWFRKRSQKRATE